jgi:hypothetical protein
MKRRNAFCWIMISICLALLALRFGGRLPGNQNPFRTRHSTAPPTTTAQPVTRPAELARAGNTRYHYAGLNEAEQRAYQDIYERLPGFPESVEVAGLDSDGLRRVFQALLLDQPLLFQISSTNYKTRSVGGKLGAFIPEYRMGPEEYKKRCEELARVCAAIPVPSGGSAFDVELALHDALVGMCEYTQADQPGKSTAYGALVENTASCEGYSRAMLLLLELRGIEASIVTGDAANAGGQTGGHAWNKVRIDGAWYHLDATWDDPVAQDAPSGVSHAYFNLPDADIAYTHELTDTRNPCVSVEANYFVRKGLYFKSFDQAAENRTAQRLAETLAAGGAAVELRMSDDGAMNSAMAELFGQGSPQRVYSILSACAGYGIRTDYVRHSEISALRVIRIVPEMN